MPLVARARKSKRLFGGAMRQAGIVAAASLYALDHHIARLANDHARARRLAAGLAAAGMAVDAEVESNIVLIDVSPLAAKEAIDRVAAASVGLSDTVHPTRIRALTTWVSPTLTSTSRSTSFRERCQRSGDIRREPHI